MSKSKSKSKMSGIPETAEAPIAAGDTIRFIEPGRFVEHEARVIESHPGGFLDLVYRDEAGRLATAEAVPHGPGEAGKWSREGEIPAPPPIPEAGGRALAVGAAIVFHSSTTDTVFENAYLTPGRIAHVSQDGSFEAVLDLGEGATTTKRFGVRSYSGDRFRSGRWSWASDGIEAPGPRRYGYADRKIRCPLTGDRVSRGLAVQVFFGEPRGYREADAFVSEAGAALLRRVLAGKPVDFPALAAAAPEKSAIADI